MAAFHKFRDEFRDEFRAQATLMDDETRVSLGRVLQIGRENHKEMLGRMEARLEALESRFGTP